MTRRRVYLCWFYQEQRSTGFQQEEMMSRKKVCILYTGGTIGMVRTENGFAPAPGTFEQEMAAIRDLSSRDMPEWDLVEFNPLLDSSNITYEQWNQIAAAIESRYDDYDGFVVLHGTDTMAYSASALSFMLEGLGKPVIFTGSQIPLSELRSDGKDNLITSVMIAAQGKAREVCLYFSNVLLRGNRATKDSADRMIAFRSPNYVELAKAGIVMEHRKKAFLHTDPGSKMTVRYLKDTRLGVIKVFPGIKFDLFTPIVDELQGLVLEAFGTGNIPNYDTALTTLIEEAARKGTIVVVCTQCPQGAVRLGAYEAGSELVRAGAVNGYDMTTEAAVAKLQYLLSQDIPSDEIRRLMSTDLRGELTN